MNETFTLSKDALVKLLLSAYPNPEDDSFHLPHFGPHDPIGPISHLAWVMLNPQPLPPLEGRQFANQRRGPHPQAWKGTLIARVLIERTVAQLQFAEWSAEQERGEQARASIFTAVMDEVDGLCGTFPNKFPWWWWFLVHPIPVPDPGPEPPISPAEIDPAILLTAGAAFTSAARITRQGELHDVLNKAADRLLHTGLNRLQAG